MSQKVVVLEKTKDGPTVWHIIKSFKEESEAASNICTIVKQAWPYRAYWFEVDGGHNQDYDCA